MKRAGPRHSRVVRITHWFTAGLIFLLLGTGFNIFNAHPFLYWGHSGSSVEPGTRWLAIGTVSDGQGDRQGLTIIGNASFDTSGVLGLSSRNGRAQAQAYPHWMTLPGWRDLGLARNWHFAAAWALAGSGLLYLGHGLVSGHVRRRLLPAMRPIPRPDAAYKPLQKLAYAGVVFLLLPLLMLTGLGMSPGMDAPARWIVDLFGGRQSARSLHWLAAHALLLFIAGHLFMLLVSGPWRLLRPMLTGTEVRR